MPDGLDFFLCQACLFDVCLPVWVGSGVEAAVDLVAACLFFGDVFGQFVTCEIACLGRFAVGLEGTAEYPAEGEELDDAEGIVDFVVAAPVVDGDDALDFYIEAGFFFCFLDGVAGYRLVDIAPAARQCPFA